MGFFLVSCDWRTPNSPAFEMLFCDASPLRALPIATLRLCRSSKSRSIVAILMACSHIRNLALGWNFLYRCLFHTLYWRSAAPSLCSSSLNSVKTSAIFDLLPDIFLGSKEKTPSPGSLSGVPVNFSLAFATSSHLPINSLIAQPFTVASGTPRS